MAGSLALCHSVCMLSGMRLALSGIGFFRSFLLQ